MRPAASRSSRRRTPRAPGSSPGCTRCSGTHRPSRRASRPRCKAKGRTDVRVIGQGGDGGTLDIGFACLSGMFERGDDVLYVCYDNEAYMNTGVQRSGATPPAARTATTKPVGRGARERVRPGEERSAHRDGARDPLRRDRHRRRAARPRGQGRARDGVPRRALPPRPRALPARLGLGVEGHDPHRAAREGDGALPGPRGRARRGRRRLEDPAAGAGRGVPAAPAAVRAPVRRPATHRRDRARCRRSPTGTSARFGLLEEAGVA